MRDPEEALRAARERAAARPGAPASPGTGQTLGDVPWTMPGAQLSARQLTEWALIEPDPAHVYSTRRFGGPITAFKRLLVRLLWQYLGQMSAQQSRFNAQIAAHVVRLDERLTELERASAEPRE